MNRIGLGFLGEPSAREMAMLSRKAEAAGFESIWISETRFKRDALTSAAVVADSTSRVRVATAATNVFTRGAALSAVSFASLDEISDGRAVAGIGPGSSEVLEAQGYTFDHPHTRLREYVCAMRSIWRGESYDGKFTKITNVMLDFEVTRPKVPIYLAVSGPRNLALAGELADGVILDSFTPVAQVTRAARQVRDSMESNARNEDDLEIAGAVMVALDSPDSPAWKLLSPFVATYLTLFPTIARDSGLSNDEIEQIQRIAGLEGLDSLAQQLPRSIVDALTANGSVESCRARIEEYRNAGLDLPILFTLPNQVEQIIAQIAEG